MARRTWLRFARDGQGHSGFADLDHHVHHNHLAYGAVCSVLDQLDVHDELHYTVRSGYKVTMSSKQADWAKDAHRPGVRVPRLMDCEIPIPEHVRATASRTSAQRAPDRSLSRHARRRLEARSGKLSRRVPECYKSVRVS